MVFVPGTLRSKVLGRASLRAVSSMFGFRADDWDVLRCAKIT